MARLPAAGWLAPGEPQDKNAVKWTRLSCREFKDNAVRLQLFVLAYKCAVRRPNFLRRLALPSSVNFQQVAHLDKHRP